MDRHFEIELKGLKQLILEMGGYVEKSIEQACRAILDRNPKCFEMVSTYEKKINEAHKEVDRQCLEMLARQAPVAADLRLVLVITKINTDLERMGDQACNISYTGRDYISRAPVATKVDLVEMAAKVRGMVRDSLDAFVRLDTDLSRDVMSRDDQIDQAKDQIFAELKIYMKENPSEIEASLDLILIARNLERLADHATNIAEEVIFLATGDDIRHGTESTDNKPSANF
ncbi:MAG: phosphate signaling complex protein PhoU [Bdellovibrionaceae bacterium]|nr:phosphate signaling complex protein PhoU [Bdellovibrionales bacterium]MCB9084222.1 phosphate signaling complex protein PhoU [Pseudobdellovibrionaceae bacterium]